MRCASLDRARTIRGLRRKVKFTFKPVLAIFCALLAVACAQHALDGVPSISIIGMQIQNQSRLSVSAVRLLVPVTGKYVSCGNIAPGSGCSTTFPEIEYTGNPVEITWSQGGRIYSTGQITIRLPDQLNEEKSAVVHVVIVAPGSAGAVLVQQPG